MAGSLLILSVMVGVLSAQSLPPRVPIAVLFRPEDYPLQHLALRYALQYINSEPELLRGTDLYKVELNVSQADSLSTGEQVCGVIRSGVAALFGPGAPSSMGIVQSVCEKLELPNVQIYPEVSNLYNYPDMPEYQRRCHINLYPAQESVAQAILEVLRDFLHWSDFTLLYESDDGLMRLQEVLKTSQKWDPKIIVRQFLPGSDQRQLLKEVNATNENHILLDCATESVMPVLRQALELRMMSVYHSYFITSLDTHTLNLNEFPTPYVNITMLRLVDLKNSTVEIVRLWAEKEAHHHRTLPMTADTMPTEMALMYDAVFLFARALDRLTLGDTPSFAVQSLHCDDPHESAHGFALANFMKFNQMDGMTGNIKIDRSGRRSHFKLDIVEYFTGEFKKVGWWETELGVNRTQTETEKQEGIQKSMQFKNFHVVSRLGEPFLMHNTDVKDPQGNERYVGFSIDLIAAIIEELKSDYKLKFGEELKIGFNFSLVPSNKHDDMVNELVTRRADLAICDLTMTQEREQLIDFTMPFMNLGISILYSKPVKEETRLFAFFDPFSIDVWIYVATAYLGVSILLFVLARITPGEWDNPHPCKPDPEELENTFNLMNCLWFSIGSLMGQGCDILPKAVSTRMVAGMWWFFTLIMIASYTANLAAFLTLNRMEDTIESVEDLAKQHKVKYGTMESGSTRKFFMNSNDTTFKKMNTVMSQTQPSVFVKNNEEGVDRVKKGKGLYAFFMESTSIKYQVERNCDLQEVGTPLDSKGYGIGLPVNSLYRTVMNGALLKLQERGALEELKTKWWKLPGGMSCSEQDANAPTEDSNKLGLANVGGVFVVVIAGTLAAFVMAVLELLWNCRKIAVAEKISPCEALTSELKFALNCTNANKPVRRKEEDEDKEEEDDILVAGVTAGSFAGLGFEKVE